MIKLGRDVADLSIVQEDVEGARVQCSSRMEGYNEGKWKAKSWNGKRWAQEIWYEDTSLINKDRQSRLNREDSFKMSKYIFSYGH